MKPSHAFRKLSPLLALLCSLATGSACMRFPVQKPGAKNYESVRYEGVPLKQGLRYALPYGRKYLQKSRYNTQPLPLNLVAERPYHQCSFDSLSHQRQCTHLLFTGDIMWLRNHWDHYPSPALKKHLAQADLLFGNLETPIVPRQKPKQFWPDYARYNAAPGLLLSLADSSGKLPFAGLSLANNHATDMGVDGLAATIHFLKQQQVRPMGAAVDDSLPLYARFEHQGLKIGIHASTWGLNNPADLSNPRLRLHSMPALAYPYPATPGYEQCVQAIAQMRADSIDLVVLMLHWGYEYEYAPDSLIRRWASDLTAAGAQLIIGSHSHVVQAAEYLAGPATGHSKAPQEALVYYSLGNFSTNMFTTACRLGLLAEVALVTIPDHGLHLEALPPLFVYNHIRGFAGRKRQLLLVSPYQKPEGMRPRRWKRIQREIDQLDWWP